MTDINNPQVMGFDVATDTFTTPSGFEVTIRETNGQDDGIFSKVSNQKDAKALNLYLANIITELNGETTIKPNDILKLRVRDKYYILFKSRRLSLGDEVTWSHTFPDGVIADMVEDIAKYDFDYSKDIPAYKGQEDYNPLVATPYEKETFVRFKLSSGHIVQFDYMTGIQEKKTLGVNEATLDINSRLTIRNFKLMKDESDEEGQFIENFQSFPSRIMAEIRARLDTYDSEWILPTDIRHPDTGEVTQISLFQLPDFFYPGV